MVRDDLYINVPSLFRCPISLDVMKSPVSLSTGVTYDRASIQRWLDNGNNTCPATMQVLQSKDFVPNRTLQRLIQIWSDSVEHYQSHRRVDSAVDNSVVPSQDEIKCIVEDIEKNRCCFDDLRKIMCFGEESEENRSFLAKMDGFVEMLVDFLGDKKDDINFIEQVVRVLDLILMYTAKYQQFTSKKNLDSLLLILRQGRSVQSRIGSVRIMESMSNDAESKLLIGENDELLLELIKSTGLDTDPSLIQASLSCLISISKARRVRSKLVNLKTIPELRNILTAEPNTGVISNAMTEKALKLLETLSSCKEGRAEICGDLVCIEAVVNKVFKISSEATEHAVTILWSLCYLFRDGKAREAVIKSNGLTKILLLMQSNCSPAVRQMAADLLKIFRVNSKSCLSSYDTKTTHIMPF
ncbi:U-box domain-containing protein 27 [Ricinus communis]|uniref:U-box domain-containing protein 27 n=1 Tax=Ricinus communis TaxID=3988 RepID=UPI00201B0AFF|nr:U-box domain-containing protein 27 [Ricinus communis]